MAIVTMEGIWMHYKGGLYTVIGISRCDDTNELVVVYRSPQSYGDRLLRHRPLHEWDERVPKTAETSPAVLALSDPKADVVPGFTRVTNERFTEVGQQPR